MSRNPHATNLRHHKPKRIEDKREAWADKFHAEWMRQAHAMLGEHSGDVVAWMLRREGMVGG